MKIRELRPDDKEKLWDQLRQDVKDILAKQEKDPWEVLWLDKCDRRLVAVDEQGNFGAIFLARKYDQGEEGTGFVWLVPCRGMDDNPIGFLRASKDLVRVFLSLDPWRKLVTHVDTDKQSHIDFLTRWNGFKIVESDVKIDESGKRIHKVAFTREMLAGDQDGISTFHGPLHPAAGARLGKPEALLLAALSESPAPSPIWTAGGR